MKNVSIASAVVAAIVMFMLVFNVLLGSRANIIALDLANVLVGVKPGFRDFLAQSKCSI
jgi:hypothetical protein